MKEGHGGRLFITVFQPDRCNEHANNHLVMQAAAVLLISISLRNVFPDTLDSSLTSFRKLAMWLQAMSVANDVAENAYKVLYNLVKSVPASTWPEILDIFPDDLVP